MKEIRSFESSEFRIKPESRKIEGYALLFNKESQDLGGFREIISPDALNGVIDKSDVLATYNHDEKDVLARSTNGKGTLSLEIDKNGLKYSFIAPNTPLGDEVYSAIQRGDLRNSSFAFTVASDGQTWEKRDDSYLRTITRFDLLFDVSPVFRPAYLDTTVASRSLSDIKNKVEFVIEGRELVGILNEKRDNSNEFSGGNDDDEQMVADLIEDEHEILPTPELIQVIYDGDTYTINKSIIQDQINIINEQKMNQYLSELKDSINSLKK